MAIAAMITLYGIQTKTKTALIKLNLGENKNIADNNRTKLLFQPLERYKDNLLAGNWPWGQHTATAPSGTKAWWRKPTPVGSGWVDWSHEGNQWLHSPEYRDLYVQTFREAWSTELSQAVRNQLVPGYWHETITKGRVLQQTSKADGIYNPDGPNLYQYQ